MSGETEKEPSAFTVDSLLIHVRLALAEQDRRIGERIDALDRLFSTKVVDSDRAVVTALTAINERLDLLNELRGGVATKEELDAARQTLQMLEKQILLLMPRGEADTAHNALAERVVDLKAQVERAAASTAGRSDGLAAGWAYLLAGVAAISAVVAIIATLVGWGAATERPMYREPVRIEESAP